MSASVKILVEGFTNADSVAETGEEKTCATITLVRDNGMKMIVDPGILESQQVLLEALLGENLTPDDIDYVAITHSHMDHYRNVGMFGKAKVIDYFGLWDKNNVQDWQEEFSPHVQILKTPGHDYTGITVFVNTEEGIVAICGDIFWKENYPESPKDDPYASDPKKLDQSRKLVVKMADWIVPGHSGIYKVDKDKASAEQPAKNGKKVLAGPKQAFCKNCKKPIPKVSDRCLCQPFLCYNCCECDIDCPLCGCKHKKF